MKQDWSKNVERAAGPICTIAILVMTTWNTIDEPLFGRSLVAFVGSAAGFCLAMALVTLFGRVRYADDEVGPAGPSTDDGSPIVGSPNQETDHDHQDHPDRPPAP